MHPKDRVLKLAVLYQQRGQPLPLDLLAEADHLGLSLKEFDQPIITTEIEEGDILNVETQE